jgi:hypothetical protein
LRIGPSIREDDELEVSMARLAFFFLPLGALVVFAACGDDGAQGGSGPGSGPSGPVTTGKNTGGGPPASDNGGDCTTNSECGPNGMCVELSPGGFRTCRQPIAETTECDLPMGNGGGGVGGQGGGGPVFLDECCLGVRDFEDCGGEENKCVRTPLYPSCGNQDQPHNVCTLENDNTECDTPADCEMDGSPGLCIPDGTFGSKVRKCIRIACAVDSDCVAGSNGRCVPVDEPCCPGAVRGLYCAYDGGGCRTEADCPGGYCNIASGVAACMSGTPTCN